MKQLFPIGLGGLMILLLPMTVSAGIDSYPQATYDCQISADKTAKDSRRRILTVKVRNRSKHINIYGFKVEASYLDCKAKDSKPSKNFIARACTLQSKAKLSLGSMARKPRDDIHVPPGQTRSYRYRFTYPGKPSHKKYLLEHCETHSTATFTAAEAPAILGEQQDSPEELGFWARWWQKIKSWF